MTLQSQLTEISGNKTFVMRADCAEKYNPRDFETNGFELKIFAIVVPNASKNRFFSKACVV